VVPAEGWNAWLRDEPQAAHANQNGEEQQILHITLLVNAILRLCLNPAGRDAEPAAAR
jgi:hypothetical protein